VGQTFLSASFGRLESLPHAGLFFKSLALSNLHLIMGLTAHHGTGCPERIRLSATPFRRGAGNRNRRDRENREEHTEFHCFSLSLCYLLLDSSSNMTNPASPTLLKLASEAIVPLINGCAKIGGSAGKAAIPQGD